MGLNSRDSVVVVKEEAVEGCKDSGTFCSCENTNVVFSSEFTCRHRLCIFRDQVIMSFFSCLLMYVLQFHGLVELLPFIYYFC